MANVLDVASYILEQRGEMTTWKLQKLIYYAQAWSLVWDDDVLFEEEITAWANGPVVRALYEAHKGQFKVTDIPGGDFRNLSANQKDTIGSVLDFYGPKSAQWLSDLTHMEEPWQRARVGLADGERGGKIIPKQHLAEYYGSLRA